MGYVQLGSTQVTSRAGPSHTELLGPLAVCLSASLQPVTPAWRPNVFAQTPPPQSPGLLTLTSNLETMRTLPWNLSAVV